MNADATAPIRATIAERIQAFAMPVTGWLPTRVQHWLSGEAPIVIDGQTLDPQLQLIRALHYKQNPYGYCEPNVPAARVRLRREATIFTGPRTPVGNVRDFTIPGDGGPLHVRHYAPPAETVAPNGGSPPLLVFLHGGGFVVCDLETHDEPCRFLCRHAGMHVLSIDYRLAPEHPFPAALHDTETALRWAQQNAATLGADPARITIGGDSAGGNLATVASRLAARDGRPPAAQLLIYPATDALTPRPSRALFGDGFFLHSRDVEAFARYYVSGTGVHGDDPRVSPIYAADLHDLPPALVVTAGFDVLRDEGDAYAAALKSAGNVVQLLRFPTLGHVFINMTGAITAARDAMLQIARDWRTLLDTVPSAPAAHDRRKEA